MYKIYIYIFIYIFIYIYRWSDQRLFRQQCLDFLLCNFVPELLRQHCTGYFVCEMLSGVFGTILRRVLTCAVLSQEYEDNTEH